MTAADTATHLLSYMVLGVMNLIVCCLFLGIFVRQPALLLTGSCHPCVLVVTALSVVSVVCCDRLKKTLRLLSTNWQTACWPSVSGELPLSIMDSLGKSLLVSLGLWRITAEQCRFFR